MSKYWSPIIKDIHPYIPGEQPREGICVKLNTNENPYPPSPQVLAAISRCADSNLRLYPDPECGTLKESLAKYHGVRKDQVFVGNGSDEILAFCFLAFFKQDLPILFPDISYSFYEVYANIFGIEYELIPLNQKLDIVGTDYNKPNGGIIFPNPNAPTAKLLPIDAVKQILLQNLNSVVIVDEAYIDFGGDSVVDYLNEFPNLLVVRTFSKSRSLAGLRVGYALGQNELIDGLERVKNSFNSYTLDRVALLGAEESIKDEEYFQSTRKMIIRTREKTKLNLELLGFEVLESSANFIFTRHSDVAAQTLFQKLRDKGILVRYFNKPRIDNFLRISIGTDQEMDCLVDALKEIIGELGFNP